MSTILETLKKLEEEKSVLEQNLDLKRLVLKDDATYPIAARNERRRFFLIAAIVAGALLVGGATVYLLAPSAKEAGPTFRPANTTPAPAPTTKKNSPPRIFDGIPMTGIAVEETPRGKLESVRNLFEPPVTEEAPREPQAPALPADFQEINDLIKSAKASAAKISTAPTSIQKGHIPGLRVKGIIFFDEGSPSNHIITTTPTHRNLKLRAGDSTQNATLKSIHPNRAVFSYQGELIEIDIGQ